MESVPGMNGMNGSLSLLCAAVEEVATEPEDLDGCEGLILGSSLKNNFLKIGQALVNINDKKLYKKAGASSFTQYIEQKAEFGFGPRQALRLLAATRLVRSFPPTVAVPTSERQVRALVGLEQQQAIKVWVKANLIAQETGVPLTHRLVESVLGKELPASYRQASRNWQDYVSPDSEYYITPLHILAGVRKVFGGRIDCDPCSDEKANEVVGAEVWFGAEDDGLAASNVWSGRVYINPPSGMVNNDNIQGLFMERAIAEFKGGKVEEAILFLKVAIGQKWFSRIFDFPHCWVSEPKATGTGKKGGATTSSAAERESKAPRGMVVVYVGKNVKHFCEVFSEHGHIPGYNAWSRGNGEKLSRRTRSSDGDGPSSSEGGPSGITVHATAIPGPGPDGNPLGFTSATLPNGLPLDPASAAAQGYGLGQNPFAGLQNFPGAPPMAFPPGQAPNMPFPMGAGGMFPMTFNPQQMAMPFAGFPGMDGSAASANGAQQQQQQQQGVAPGSAQAGQAGSQGGVAPQQQGMTFDPRQAAMFPAGMPFPGQGFDPRMMQFAAQQGFGGFPMAMQGMQGFAGMSGVPGMSAEGAADGIMAPAAGGAGEAPAGEAAAPMAAPDAGIPMPSMGHGHEQAPTGMAQGLAQPLQALPVPQVMGMEGMDALTQPIMPTEGA